MMRGMHSKKGVRLTLKTIRKGCGKTQEFIAEAAEMTQSEVSRLEDRSDFKFSTLERYAKALGAKAAVCFEFPDGRRIFVATPV